MSKGEENLIAAVLSDSQDYTSRSSRRVYADWLEEQGDPISQIQANPQMETRRVSEGEATTDSALADASGYHFLFQSQTFSPCARPSLPPRRWKKTQPRRVANKVVF